MFVLLLKKEASCIAFLLEQQNWTFIQYQNNIQ